MRILEWINASYQEAKQQRWTSRETQFLAVSLPAGGTFGLGVGWCLTKLLERYPGIQKYDNFILGFCGLYLVGFSAWRLQADYTRMIRLLDARKEAQELNDLVHIFFNWVYENQEASVEEIINTWRRAFRNIKKDKIDVISYQLLSLKNILKEGDDLTEEEDRCRRQALDSGFLREFFKIPEIQGFCCLWRDPLLVWKELLEDFKGHPGYLQLEEEVKNYHRDFLTYRKLVMLDAFYEELMAAVWAPERIKGWIEQERWDLLD